MELLMGFLAPKKIGGGVKETQSHRTTTRCSSTKVERKIVEKNRRNHMKYLYSKLNSLLPQTSDKEQSSSMPEQLDEAVKYIKSLEKRLKALKERKEKLKGRKRSHRCDYSSGTTSSEAPQMEIQEMGNALQVFLVTGLDDDHLMFYDIVRILGEEGAEIANANYSTVGNTIFHFIHAEIGESKLCVGAPKMVEKLNKFVGESGNEQLWSFETHPETRDF